MKNFKISISSTIDRNNTSISGYFKDIKRYGVISPDEEAQLAFDAMKGGVAGERAKRRLIEANLGFVISVANQYKQSKLELADLISEGNIDLIRAAETFDPTKGIKFISYAVWWIRQSIMNAIDNCSTTLRLPSNQIRVLQKYRKMDAMMMQEEQRHITLQEFCDATGTSEESAADIIAASYASYKMDAPIAEDSDSSYGDMLSSNVSTDDTLDHESLCYDLTDAVSHCLTAKEADIVRRHFGIDCAPATIQYIADDYGLSYERTRQIIKNALTKIRASKYSRNLSMHLAA